MGPGLVFQLNQKGVGGMLPPSGHPQPAGGTDGGAGPLATLLRSARFSTGYLLRFGAPNLGLRPQGQWLLLNGAEGEGRPGLNHLNIHSHSSGRQGLESLSYFTGQETEAQRQSNFPRFTEQSKNTGHLAPSCLTSPPRAPSSSPHTHTAPKY